MTKELILTISTLCGLGVGYAQNSVQKPNVLVILVDDLGYGDLSTHGNPIVQTPHIDILRGQSISMTNFHVAPMSSPTRGELMTGMDAMRSGCTAVNSGRSMPHLDYKMMPEYFQDAGYATGHFGKWHLGDSYPYRPQDRGFEYTLHFPSWGLTSLADAWTNDYFDPILEDGEQRKQYDGYCTDIFFDEAMDYMLQCKKEGKSFFTYLATNTCHAPELVPEKYAEKYRKVKQYNGVAVPDMFYGMIANLDENMGRLELFLIENNLKDNTIVVFSSDNGTQNTNAYKIFNAGMQGKKQSAFDGGHRVPLFITYMNGTLMSGVCRDDLTQAQDILPTLLDLAGIEDQPQCDGVSLKPLFKTMNNRLEDRMCVVQYKMGSKWDAKNCVVMWDNWRLLSRGRLYDISRDPHQDKNIASKHPEVVKAMSDYYDQWYAEVKPLFDRKRYITIGADAANPTMLYANDWNGDACDNSAALFQANGTGYFDIDIAKSGNYKITISRWPDDANLPLNGYDDKFIVYTNNTQGKCNNPSDAAKPIAKAEIKVGEYSKKVKVKAKDTSVSFNVELESGKSTLEGLFYNSEGDVICGALYIEVERK